MNVRITQSRHRAPAGFTLMEVLLVLVILVILGSFAAVAITNAYKGAKKDQAEAQIGLFKTPLNLYELHMSQLPSTSQGLQALREPPAELANSADWQGPYLEDPVPLDPWGNVYQYSVPGKFKTDSYDIWSTGPDGQDGSDDDIGNWTNEV